MMAPTGNLEDVMKESIQVAQTVVRSRAIVLGVSPEFYDKVDIHIHVPEGAVKKDGPSAGIGMTTALVSALTEIPVRADVAMTGEITLRGEVLPIGGLERKTSWLRIEVESKRLSFPNKMKKILSEIPDNIKEQLDIRPVRWIDEVLEIALTEMPTPLEDGENLSELKKKISSVGGKEELRHH